MELYRKIKAMLSNPVVGLFLAIAIAYVFYAIGTKTMELSYSLIKPTIIYNSTTSDSKLEISWKGGAIDSSIVQLDIPIWNSGDQYIDFNQVSKSNPISFHFQDDDIEVIDSSIQNKSRESLDVKLIRDGNQVTLDFVGDDALEAKEGFFISVLYLSKDADMKPVIEAKGRVKGIPAGITEGTWTPIDDGRYLPIGLGLAFFWFVGILLFIASEQFFKSIPYFSAFLYSWLIPLVCAICLLFGALFFWAIVVDMSMGLTWRH
ncbi:TPA: hypothetical protein ACF4E7_004664 [Vibrio parahaemolyticus]|uniref:hypothetical protein n=1 Tax=Vibrio parahaemolyticus TaxID=670 RepID=UPI00235EE143|nr:hypothetical protein [Vibrio parahaemolyticus]HCG8450657.1 hypothetical protein [Vibrio parahaemolyticus]